MSTLENVFSPQLIELMKADETADIRNINKYLVELLVAGLFSMEEKHLIWVVGENENLQEKSEKLKLWLQFLGVKAAGIHFYTKPFEDPYINNTSSLNAVRHKVDLLSALKERKPLIVLTTRSALSIRIERKEELKKFFLKASVGQAVTRADLTGQLIAMGYRARGIVEDSGDVAWRGSIVDVFPIDSRHPVRLEIEGEKIISIRYFDPDTQKSIEKIGYILFPMARYFLDFENNSTYFQERKLGMTHLPGLMENYRLIGSDRR
ncbi:MAG: hypothetical protein GY950_02220, partial [bacterium]|nr:hypothetical protein [bacterium]